MAIHNVTGKLGEQTAVNFLTQHGYKILATNFKSKLGEIDIVARDGKQTVFVEVKTRSGVVFGTPAEAIGYKKLLSIIRTAQYFLIKNKLDDYYRIDAVEVEVKGSEILSINQIKNITI